MVTCFVGDARSAANQPVWQERGGGSPCFPPRGYRLTDDLRGARALLDAWESPQDLSLPWRLPGFISAEGLTALTEALAAAQRSGERWSVGKQRL